MNIQELRNQPYMKTFIEFISGQGNYADCNVFVYGLYHELHLFLDDANKIIVDVLEYPDPIIFDQHIIILPGEKLESLENDR